MKRTFAISAYVLAVVVTLVSVVDSSLIMAIIHSIRPTGLLDIHVVFGLYIVEFIVFTVFRQHQVGNRYVNLAMMCLSGLTVVGWFLIGLVLMRHFPGPS